MVSRGTTLTVTLTGDASQLKRVLGGADRDMQQLERASGRASSSVITGFSVMALGATAAAGSMAVALGVAKGLADTASALAEQQNKVGAVFGASSGLLKNWGDTAAQSMGMSERAALQAAATFGNLFTSMGLTQSASASMSMSVTQLASDLSSFNDVPVADALAALQSGLVGETEPMRRFGVVINAATVEAKALQMGLAATKAEISESDKVLARYNLILEGTKNAQGDFARTSNSAANAQRELQANVENLRAELGQNLLPAYESILGATNDLLATNGQAWAADFATGVDGLTAAMGDLLRITGDVDAALRVMTGSGVLGFLWQGFSTAIPGLKPLAAAGSWLMGRGEQQQLERVQGGRGAGLTDAEVDPFGWSGIAKAAEVPAAILPDVAEGLERVGLGAKSLVNDDLKMLTGAVATLSTELNASADAAMRAAEAEASLTQQRQNFYRDYLNQLGGRGVRFAPGVFEGLARQAGLTPIGDFTDITQTDLRTGETTPVPRIDVSVP